MVMLLIDCGHGRKDVEDLLQPSSAHIFGGFAFIYPPTVLIDHIDRSIWR